MFGQDDGNDNTNNGIVPTVPMVSPDPIPNSVLDNSNSPDPVSSPAPAPNFAHFTPIPSAPPAPSNDTSFTESSDTDLLDIKQKALEHLTPLVDHLDQTPEEKFRTTMMMIQASDNEKLIATAFASAKEIKDDKERAQALLDVINEINYFSQSPENNSKV